MQCYYVCANLAECLHVLLLNVNFQTPTVCSGPLLRLFCFFEIVSLYRHVWAGIHCIDQTIPKLSSCLPSVEVTGMYYYTQLGLSVVDLIFSTLFA